VRPPFQFTGVTARVFPLKANMARLAAFCDAYVNMDIPPEIVHYRPALPYVYLMVLDYGSMSSASMHAQNVGWVAQHEVAFTVPLERWRKENGKLVFKDWACVSPFIFVDDEMSLTTGREVYGWPKVAGTVDASVSLWASHPLAGSRVFSFNGSSRIGGEQARVAHHRRRPALSYARFRGRGQCWSPECAGPATRSSLSPAGQAADLWALPVRGFAPTAAWARSRLGTRAVGWRVWAAVVGRAAGHTGRADRQAQLRQHHRQAVPRRGADRACYRPWCARAWAWSASTAAACSATPNCCAATPRAATPSAYRYGSQPIISRWASR
jgi:hypothetical protein